MSQLQQMIAIASTAPGANGTGTVALNANGVRDLIPDVIAFDNPAFDYVSLVGTTLTVINRGASAGITNVWLLYFQSINRSYGGVQNTALTPTPFVIRGAATSTSSFAPVYGKMSTAVNQAVADLANDVQVVFDTTVYESASTVVDIVNSQFVIPTDGVYAVTANFRWIANPGLAVDSSFGITIKRNALVNATARVVQDVATGGTTPGSTVLATAVTLVAADTLQLVVSQLSQESQTSDYAEFTLSRVG